MVMYVVIFPAIAFAATFSRYIPAVVGVCFLLLLIWFDLANNLTPARSWVEIHPVLRALPSFFIGAALFYNRNLVRLIPAPKLLFAASFALLVGLMILVRRT
jgi:hypothetical protein